MSAQALDEANRSQAEAADPTFSVFVTANAGSGKTKVLVDRIARLLLAGSKPSAFLCITYTKAAAAEMQRRLFERLGAWCVMDDAQLRDDLTKLGEPNADLPTARALFAQALETPGGLKIQTIHAFCERLLARFPLEARVPPGFDIADESRAAALLSEARAQAALGPDAPKQAFTRFAAQMGADQLEGLLDRLALSRAAFHRYTNLHQGPIFAEAALKDRHGVRESAEEARARFFAALDQDSLRRAIGPLGAGSKQDQGWAEGLKAALAALDAGDSVRAAESCFEAAFTGQGKGEPRKKLATGATNKAHPWLNPLLLDFIDACLAAREQLNAIARAEDAVAALALALALDRAYAAAKSRTGALDFDDLIEYAQTLLQHSAAAPWVLYKLDGGLDHILIDEGQDTSPSQWELIAPLQNEFFAGVGARTRERTMFAVGDPKQSIYGFQGADPARFLAERTALFTRAREAERKFTAPDLRTSFRSAPHILRVVDEVIKDKPLIAAPPGQHDVVAHLPARDDALGMVELWPVLAKADTPEARAWDAPLDVQKGVTVHAQLAQHLAQRVKAMIEAREAVWDKDARVVRPMHAGDVLALVRKRGPLFYEMIKAFKRAGMPVAGADRMILRDELAVEDCLALIRTALDPADDLSLACVLKGPWCNLDDDDAHLYPLAADRGKGETLHARLMASADPVYAEAQAFVRELGQRAGADAFAFLSWALETPDAAGLSGWEKVFARIGAEARDPLEELLQRALKPGAFAAPSLQRFLYDIELDDLAVKRELEAESGAVRVMTVHGAKGLEAPIVILADTTGKAGDKPDNGLMFDDDDGPFLSQRKADDDAITAAARAAHEARELSEHWRLLYVALTRARDRLIVCGPWHGTSAIGETPESWRAAVEVALQNLGAEEIETPAGRGLRYGAPQIAAAEGEALALPAHLPAWARTPVAGAVRLAPAAPSRAAHAQGPQLSPGADGQKRFRRGRFIHGLLQRLPEIAAEAREAAALRWLARRGAEEGEAQALAREALAVLNDARFAPVFGPGSRAEAPIIGEAAGKPVRGVVDRLVVNDAGVIVLDFKTDRPAPADPDKTPEAYLLQMALYRAVLQRIFPGRPVSCALVSTEAPALMALPPGRLDAVLAAFAAG
ncbi:MAG TPA: double-strand break repair helicase AddA [Terricaulis sp.]|nr:double-strand break repair helicase AddA [Terricaulis sp.]